MRKPLKIANYRKIQKYSGVDTNLKFCGQKSNGDYKKSSLFLCIKIINIST